MGERLLVAVLGNRNSGKSKTWNTLFERSVRTGTDTRVLFLNKAQWVGDVFLVNGSPQERNVVVEDMLPDELPTIVLCSIQYRDEAKATFNHFFSRGYDVVVQWLNPGYQDGETYQDNIELIEWLLNKGAVVSKRSGKDEPGPRVNELRQYILGWATLRNLVCTEF
jgi:hypothetical protein